MIILDIDLMKYVKTERVKNGRASSQKEDVMWDEL